MKLIVDSNILFTFFWKNSVFQKMAVKQDLELLSPEFALVEINKYKSEIIKKTKISEKEFDELKKELALMVEFIPIEEYSDYLSKVKELLTKVSDKEKEELINDIDFIALSLKHKFPIWSNNQLMKKIDALHIINTKELIQLLK